MNIYIYIDRSLASVLIPSCNNVPLMFAHNMLPPQKKVTKNPPKTNQYKNKGSDMLRINMEGPFQHHCAFQIIV